MTHVRRETRRPDKALVDAFRGLGVATVYEASGRKGYVGNALRPIAPDTRICGPAYTVQCAPGDNLMLHKALQRAAPGDVLVATVGGAPEYGYWGALMATAGIARGLGGLVIDGCVRDSAEIKAMGFPVFCRGFSIRGTTKAVLGLINYPVNVSEAPIFPGDLLLGDSDGLVVVRLEACRDVLESARERVRAEERKAERLRSGVSSVELNGLDKTFASLGLIEE